MKKKRKKKLFSKGNLAVISVALAAFTLYAVITLVGQQLKIAEKKEELEQIQDQIVLQEIKNDELNEIYNLDDDENNAYIERVAREEFDYSKKGERVFINIAGE